MSFPCDMYTFRKHHHQCILTTGKMPTLVSLLRGIQQHSPWFRHLCSTTKPQNIPALYKFIQQHHIVICKSQDLLVCIHAMRAPFCNLCSVHNKCIYMSIGEFYNRCSTSTCAKDQHGARCFIVPFTSPVVRFNYRVFSTGGIVRNSTFFWK